MERSFLHRARSLRFWTRAAVLVVAVLAAVAGAKALWDRQIFQGYDEALALEPKILETGQLAGFRTETVEITGLKGERLPLKIIFPNAPATARHRCVVFLYGIGQNMRFFDEIAPLFAAQGVAMAMPEQFNRGVRRQRGLGIWKEALAFRERASRIVPETRRVVDYLAQRGDIDADRLDFLGASYGGIMGCAVLAQEPRLRCGALVMAGGNFRQLLGSMARRHRSDSRLIWPAAAEVAAWFVSPFEPLRYIGRVAPRPLLFLTVEDDELIAPACSQALYDAAGQPKSEIRYQGGHDAITEDTVRQMMRDVLKWLASTDP